MPVIRTYAATKPILGVCLGEQAIGEAFGAQLCNLSDVFHGVQTEISLDGPGVADDYLFDGLPRDEGLIMGLRHRKLDVHGIQFHPESVLTPLGERIIQNWINH